MNVLGLPCCVNQTTTSFPPKKRRHHPSGSNVSELRISDHVVDELSTATLVSYNLREAVKLPYGQDINEWLAIHTIDFYNIANVLYATLKEFCTTTTCPIMNAGSLYEYRWADGIAIKKPISVSAPEYVEYLMNWIVTQIDNETIFPKKPGTTFPPNFKDSVKVILKRLFRVYAHIYHCHFQNVVNLEEEAHLNTCFKHLVLFISEYQLIDEAGMEPLKELVGKILKQ
ncbi:hypothetical protein Bca52824_036500 [Brassica carinata]|uniref:Uncharacterized protein n=1 Tax=Brassica carinata TaxID=52824 RepID=A0A8X7S5E0_BRACI|nr:hypothetical protein Bca52824_036500 [Brassica carinata]